MGTLLSPNMTLEKVYEQPENDNYTLKLLSTIQRTMTTPLITSIPLLIF